jgi:Zn-dependent M28 family amino/carboxypeptidase
LKNSIIVAAIVVVCLFVQSLSFSQAVKEQPKLRPYEAQAQQIIARGLSDCEAYKLLFQLTTTIGNRISGSPQAERAVELTQSMMEKYDFDNVHKEKIMVPHWVRGTKEECEITNDPDGKNISLKICALGGSIGTPKEGITAEIIEVLTFEELTALGDKAKGKIIFFNRPFDKAKFNTFEMYGGAVGQRWSGAMEASKAGGVAALVRSMTTRLDDVPHTGVMGYADSIRKVPAAAVSTVGAKLLSDMLKKEGKVTIHLNFDAETLPEVESANVVGELKGTEHPEEVIVIGGHLDSWDKGQGAHDDGAGTMQSIEALRILKALDLKPKRTIRAVMFMNEENGGRGGKGYADKSRPGEKHIAAIESDAGGFTPRGFGVTADSLVFEKIAKWSYLFEGIDAARIHKGGGGSDIGPLGAQKVPTLGLNVDVQRYFDYHHSDNDTIDKVNERELELGAIAMAIMSYVIAEEGL